MSKVAMSLQPLYLQVKRHILDNIGSGKWGAASQYIKRTQSGTDRSAYRA